MFDIGFGEMMLLAGIALIAIGPKQLPEVARTVGRLLNEFRRASSEFTRTIVDARETTNQFIQDAQKPFNEIAKSIEEKELTKESVTPKIIRGEEQMVFHLQDQQDEPQHPVADFGPATGPHKKDS